MYVLDVNALIRQQIDAIKITCIIPAKFSFYLIVSPGTLNYQEPPSRIKAKLINCLWDHFIAANFSSLGLYQFRRSSPVFCKWCQPAVINSAESGKIRKHFPGNGAILGRVIGANSEGCH